MSWQLMKIKKIIHIFHNKSKFALLVAPKEVQVHKDVTWPHLRVLFRSLVRLFYAVELDNNSTDLSRLAFISSI